MGNGGRPQAVVGAPALAFGSARVAEASGSPFLRFRPVAGMMRVCRIPSSLPVPDHREPDAGRGGGTQGGVECGIGRHWLSQLT